MLLFDYSSLKHAHIGVAVLSAILFIVRGAAALLGRYSKASRYRRLIHGIDAVLLSLGLLLAWQLSLSPWNTPWLAAKIIAIVLYILCGVCVLRSHHRGHKALAYVIALLLLGYIFTVALSKSPWGVLSLLG